MKIGIITQWFASGAGHVSRSYAKVLSNEHNVFIYARGGQVMQGDPTWDGPEVTWAPPHPCSTGIHAKHFIKWVKDHSIEVVLFNEQRHWSGIVLAKRLGLLTGGYVDYYTQNTVSLFNLYDFLICNTQRHFSVFKNHPQCLFVPWGVDTDVFKPSFKHSIRPLTFIISSGWDGRYAKNAPWMDRRGTGLAIRTFRRVDGNCRLLVFSQVALSECPSDWQAHVKADPRIDFRVGTFSPFPYCDGDIYVYPSRLDGIGLTLPEALSCGLPAITTDSPPMNEFVHHGENGLLVKVRSSCARPDGYYWPESLCDEDALTDAMLTYLKQPELVQIHSMKAYELADRDLVWEKNAVDLGNWIAAQKKLNVDIADYSLRCARYDRTYSPTPFQRFLVSGYIFIHHLLTCCRQFLFSKK